MLNLVNDLKTVVDKIDLYELASEDSLGPEVKTFGSATGTTSPTPPAEPSTVIHISHSTFGTLNTGEVLGSIHSHVTSASGPTAEAFRVAIEALANDIASDRSLSEEARNDALESIDYLAESGGDLPEKRRTGIVHRTLTALPDALKVSAGALEAWDKYGEPVRKHFGL